MENDHGNVLFFWKETGKTVEEKYFQISQSIRNTTEEKNHKKWFDRRLLTTTDLHNKWGYHKKNNQYSGTQEVEKKRCIGSYFASPARVQLFTAVCLLSSVALNCSSKGNFSTSFGSVCHRLKILLSRDVSRCLTYIMLIFQPLVLKFPSWCLYSSKGLCHHGLFNSVCSVHKQKASHWEWAENVGAGWCC